MTMFLNKGRKVIKLTYYLDGRVAIEVNGKKVAEISEMEIFGEMSLILNKPRTASIKALKPSIVLPIDQKILNDLLSECPPVISSLVKQLAYRLSQCDQKYNLLKIKQSDLFNNPNVCGETRYNLSNKIWWNIDGDFNRYSLYHFNKVTRSILRWN